MSSQERLEKQAALMDEASYCAEDLRASLYLYAYSQGEDLRAALRQAWKNYEYLGQAMLALELHFPRSFFL